MQRVLAFLRTELLQLDLGRSARDPDLRSIVQLAAVATLKPRHFAIFFSHTTLITYSPQRRRARGEKTHCSLCDLRVSAVNPNLT